MAEETGIGIRCQRCGAPLDVTPETIVAVCKYCGFPNWTAQAYVYPIVIVPAKSREAARFFEKYIHEDPDMKGLADKVTLKRIETVYVPVYFATVAVESRYYGKANVTLTKVEVYTDSKGRVHTRTKTRVVRVDVRGTYNGVEDIDIIARRSVDETELRPLLVHYRKTVFAGGKEGVPISQVNWEEVKGEVLAAEVAPQAAQTYARDQACDITYGKVKEIMENKAKEKAAAMNPGWIPTMVSWDVLRIPCKAENRWLSPITLVPYIEAIYSYEGKLYRTVFAGWDGRRVYGEEPMLALQRAVYFGGALFSSGVLGGGGLAALAASAGHSTIAAIVGLGAFALGMIGSYYLSKESLKDVRVEKEE
ncbi:MAG: hypothetical protein F7C35_05680 [Desulfurococcales archaeon]|nr:hypothetical protein [Desulfurococcales archaeon]